jgi:predicted Fe-Mo cluster-binding NifX family protein
MKKALFLILVLFLFVTGLVFGQPKEKIAIAADGKTTAAKVSSVAARSPYYLLFDGSGKLLETLENPYQAAKSGAAASVLSLLEKKGVTLIIAGDFGDNMIRDMKGKRIKYVEFKGSVKEALEKGLGTEK